MPLPPDTACTCFRLRRAARQASQLYDRALAAIGLSLNEYSILRRAQKGTRTLGELAEVCGMDRSTLTRNLRPLLASGLLREARGEDARQRLIQLTPKGERAIAQAIPLWQQAQAQMTALFGAGPMRRLNDDLDALHVALRPLREAA
ncbi:MarR family winged helix-turn-helix transcriptional regulator [Pseudoxanthomonas winnipegensis]|uniref:MarR family winged helix-turn-helix transcriptional regulator n=1 Tax=Pseudoxanthomonas winnipegensis TaxID=2480810 RepID=UPI0030F466F7